MATGFYFSEGPDHWTKQYLRVEIIRAATPFIIILNRVLDLLRVVELRLSCRNLNNLLLQVFLNKIMSGTARGSYNRTKLSVGGRSSPSTGGRGRGSPSSVSGGVGRGGPSSVSGGVGRGSPSTGGRGRGSPSSVSGGRGRNGITGSNDVDLHEHMDADLNENSESLDASHDGRSEDVEMVSSHDPRGSNTMDQVPTDPSNRIVVELLGTDFAESNVTRQIVSIFKNMFRGPWIKWSEVPKSHRDKMWNHFKQLYQWHPEIDKLVYKAWENVLKSRYRDIMSYARDEAKKLAEEANVRVGTNFDVLKPFKPVWINQEYWDKMIDKWNTPQWKNKSKKNKKNKNTLVNGVIAKHTGGSIKMSVIRRKMEKQLGRPLLMLNCIPNAVPRNPERQIAGHGSSLHRLQKKILKKYMIEKFGSDISTHPLGDLEAWERAVGGVKKGRLKGAPSDPGFVVTGILSTQSASQLSATGPGPDPAYVDEVERLKAQVASLLEERKQEKEVAEAAAARMTAIEQMLAKFAPSTTAE